MTAMALPRTGAVASLGRKKAIYQICQQEDIIILEDDPYYYLQFRTGSGAQLPSHLMALVDFVKAVIVIIGCRSSGVLPDWLAFMRNKEM